MYAASKFIKKSDYLAAILISAALLLAIQPRLNFGFNSGHMDEYDYLFAGKMLLLGIEWPTHTYIFGADFNWYPFAGLDFFTNNLSATRVVSLLWGVLSLIGMFQFTKALWNNRFAAASSTALLSVEAAHIYTSKYISYDIVSFCLFVWSLYFILIALSEKNAKNRWLLAGSTLIALAVLSKYIVVLYLPLIAAAAFYINVKRALIGTLLVTSIIGLYVLTWKNDLSILLSVQLSDTHTNNSHIGDILERVLAQQLILYGLLAIAIALIAQMARKKYVVAIALIVFSLPMIFYHLYSENLISLYKHLVYNSIFLIPIIAYAFALLVEHVKSFWFSGVTGVAVIVCFAFYNNTQLTGMEQGFPNSSAMLNTLPSVKKSDSVLSENPYLFRYHLHNKLSQDNIKESNWFDNNRDGIIESTDIEQAIWDRKFEYVYLNDQVHKYKNVQYRQLLEQRGYHLLYNSAYKISDKLTNNTEGHLTLYKRSPLAKTAKAKATATATAKAPANNDHHD